MRFLSTVAGATCFFATAILHHVLPESSTVPNRLIDRRGLKNLPPVVGGLDFDLKDYANDAEWKKYTNKGEYLTCLMKATDRGAGSLIENQRIPASAASPWKGDLKKELATWFWHVDKWYDGWFCDFERIGLKQSFLAQGLNARPAFDDDGKPADGHNECFSLKHFADRDSRLYQDQKYYVNGKEYSATGAFYQFAMNRVDGAIIAKNINSPSNAVLDAPSWGRKAKPGELPELRFLSDIYWGYWIRGNPNVRNIRVYGAENVVNDATVLLVSRALRNNKVQGLAPWPGTSFSAGSEEGKALIGSPIGATIAHMLLAHKAELGIKHISRVTIVTNEGKERPRFRERPRKDLHIFFGIEDVPISQRSKKRNMPTEGMDLQCRVVYANKRSMLREHVVRF